MVSDTAHTTADETVDETADETVDEMRPQVLVAAVGRPTFDVASGAEHVAAAVDLLDRVAAFDVTVLRPDRGDVVFTDRADLVEALDRCRAPVEVVVVLQATFSDSTLVATIAERLDAPLIVWSFPEERTGERLRLNSLCGANLAAYLLRRPPHRGRRVEFLHLDPLGAASGGAPGVASGVRPQMQRSSSSRVDPGGATEVLTELVERVAGAASPVVEQPSGTSTTSEEGRRLAAMFHGDRIGVVGRPPDGFEPCRGDADELQAVTGIGVERVPLGELFDRADAVDEDTRTATALRVRSTMDVPPDVEAAGMPESIALYGGLRTLALEHGWTALTTRCWPECMTEYGGAVCTPMAMLTENGVPAVCEADMYGAATALLLHHVAGSEPFVADLVDADPTDDTSVVWHCGVAPATLAHPAETVTAITHPNRHRALANQFGLRPGRVTVARLSQAGGRLQLVVGGGEMLDRPRPFSGTCGVLEWDEPVEDVLATVFDLGLEHHLGIVYGDHRPALAALADEWGVPVVWLGHTR